MLDFIRKRGPNHAESDQASAGTGSAGTLDLSRFNKVIDYCLYALVLLVPIFFSTLTSEVRDFNKQSLVFLLMVVMLATWVIKILTTRKVSWVKTSLDFILLAYLSIYLLASIFSVDKVSSFLGYYGRFTGSFVSVLSLVVIYFLVVNNLRTKRTIQRLTSFYLVGMGIALVYSLLQIFGKFILPFAITHNSAFNPIGSIVGLGIYSALSIVFMQWLWFVEGRRSMVRTIALWVLTLVALLIVFLINAFLVWLILVLGLATLLILGMAVTTEGSNRVDFAVSPTWYWKPMLVMVIGVLFIAFQFLPALNPRNSINLKLPVEVQMSNSATWRLAYNSIKTSIKDGVLGTGPSTTGVVFGALKPASLNQTIVWNLNFDRTTSQIAGIAIETGVVGLVAFEAVSILFLVYALYFLFRKASHPGWKYAFGFFLLWFSLYITHFFYFFNFTFEFLFWFSIAVFMASTNFTHNDEEQRSFSLSSSPRSALSWMFISLLVLAVLLVGLFFEGAVYAGEVSYASGIKALNQTNPDYTKANADFTRAITLDSYRDAYYTNYGNNLIALASQEAAKPKPDINQIQTWLSQLIAAGQRATQLSPDKSSNWSALAQFYTGIRSLVAQTDPKIIDSWQKAIAHDPKNPALYVQLAQAYTTASDIIDPSIAGKPGDPDSDQDGLTDAVETQLGSNPQNSDTNGNGINDGDEVKAGFNPAGTGRLSASELSQFTRTDQAMLKKAQDALNQAIALKPDLPDSYIMLARVLEKENDLSGAQKQLDAVAKQFANNPDVLFEQGRIYYNQHDFTNAAKIFKNVIALSPNYANAHYSLGLIYQQQGDNTDALSELQKARDISGPNVDLDKLISTLKAGQPTTPGQ